MFTIYIANKRFHMFRSFEQNKNVIYIPFIKHWLNLKGRHLTISLDDDIRKQWGPHCYTVHLIVKGHIKQSIESDKVNSLEVRYRNKGT